MTAISNTYSKSGRQQKQLESAMSLQKLGTLEAEVISPNDESIRLFGAAHPFRTETVDLSLPAGLTIFEMIEIAQPDSLLRQFGHVFINDEYLPQEFWSNVRPKPGTRVNIRLVPQGGEGGKNPLRLILSIVVVAVSAWVGGGGLFGLKGIGAAIGSAVVGVVGNLIINAIAPPPSQKFDKPKTTFSIEGSRNEARPFGPIPRVLGRHRMVPPYGAMPYTSLDGDDQYLHLIFVWGYAPLEISDLRIGDTPIEEFEGNEKGGGVEIETYDGWTQGQSETFSLYPNDVYQENMSVKIEQTDGWITRTSQPNATSISIDVTFPQGLVEFDKKGKKRDASVEIEVQYKPINAGSWRTELPPISSAKAAAIQGAGVDYAQLDFSNTLQRDAYFVDLSNHYLNSNRRTIRGRQTNALRQSFEWKVPKGQYDVRVKRITADADEEDRKADEVFWTALRSMSSEDPIKGKGLAKTVVRIKATDQLNGIVDQFNGVVHSRLLDWDSSTQQWKERATSNPASLFRSVLQDSANARPLDDSRIDLTGLQEWHEWCDLAWEQYDPSNTGLKYEANHIIDYSATVRETLADIASAGRASPSIKDGKWGVVVDKEQTVPIQHFTPRNSWGFQGQKLFQDFPHGFRVRFINEEEDWRQDERIVYDGGYGPTNATKFEGLDLPGITDPRLVWIHGRYHMASARLRPELYSFSADIEHIVCTRGDLIRVTHDVPLWGLSTGRITAVQTDGGIPEKATGVTLDELCTMEAGKSYSIRFRLSDGTSLIEAVNTQAGSFKTITFQTPFDVVGTIADGDLAMFGETGKESVELIVKSIEPGPDLSARLTCFDAAPLLKSPELYTELASDTDVASAIPAFNSQITLPSGPRAPFIESTDPPIVESVRSDDSVLELTPQGDLITRILINLRPAPRFDADLVVQIRPASTDGNFVPAGRFSGGPSRVYITGVEDAQVYEIRLRWVPEYSGGLMRRRPSAWTTITHTVTGKTTPPSSIEGLTLQGAGGRATLRWDPRPEIDVQFGGEIVVRHSPALAGATWRASTFIGRASGDATFIDLPLISGTYLVRPFDEIGRPSASAAAATTKQVAILAFTGVATVTEHPNFTGTKTGVAEVSNTLRLAANGKIDDQADFDSISDLDLLDGITSAGTYDFNGSMDFTTVKSVRVTRHLDATIIHIYDKIDDRTALVDAWEDFDGTTAASGDVKVFVRQTDDDPTGSPTWSGWSELFSSEIEARALEFKAELSSQDPSYNVRIDELSVSAEELV